MKLLYDVENSRWYNENGESFDSENPTIPYGNAERVEIQLYAEVEGTNSGSGAVADWTKYTDFTGSGYGAILATDNNFLHWFKATLQTAVPAGELPVSTVIDIATNVGIDDIAESGNIYLYDGNGGNEAVAYASREAISGGIRFTPAAGNVLENAYAAGAQTDIPEMLYAEAPMIPEASDPGNGLFVFDFICDSTKLRNKMQYSSVERVDDCKGLELTIFQTHANGTVSIRKRFRCSSFRITGGIADIRTGVPVPTPEKNQILMLLHGFIARGLEIQGSIDGETWTDYAEIESFQALRWFRLRVNGSGSQWSYAVPLIVGPQGLQGVTGAEGPEGPRGPQGERGENGAAFRIDAFGPLENLSQYDDEAANFSFLDTDSGNVYLKLSDASGDWSDPVPFRGPQGQAGANGASAYEIAVANGFEGTEAEWLVSLKGEKGDPGTPGASGGSGSGSGSDGADGASAYEIAVANGFVGTEAEWLASLKGEDGSATTLTLVRPTSDLALFPVVEASASADFANAVTLDAQGNSADRAYCKVFTGDEWIDIPASGLGTPFDGLTVSVDMSTKFAGLTQPYFVRWCWRTSDGADSDWSSIRFPSVGGAGGSGSMGVNIVRLTAAGYEALSAPNANTLYLIVEE